MRSMSNKKPLVTKGTTSVKELLLIALAAFIAYMPTRFILFALIFDVCVPAAIILAIWNYVDKRREKNA